MWVTVDVIKETVSLFYSCKFQKYPRFSEALVTLREQ